MKTSETKLAAEEQNDTRRLCEDRGVSLHRSEAFILPPSLHLCHSLFDLCWLTLPFSPSPPSNNEMTCSPDSNFLPLPPLLFFLLLSIFSPSDFLLSLSSTCLRNVSEQHKRTKAWGRRRKERRGRRGRRRRRGERKLSGGKGETERLRGAESRMNGSEWRAVLCHHVLTSSISHTHTSLSDPSLWKKNTHAWWVRPPRVQMCGAACWLCHGNTLDACGGSCRWSSQRQTALHCHLCSCVSHSRTWAPWSIPRGSEETASDGPP